MGGGCFSGSRKQLNCSSRRCTNNLQAAPWPKPNTLKLCILASSMHQHVTSANGLDYLSPPEACSLSDVSGRRPVGFFRRFHLSEYGWEIKDGIICPSRLHPGEAVTVCNSSIIYTIYQLCSASDVCRITFIKKGNKKGEERQHNIILQP